MYVRVSWMRQSICTRLHSVSVYGWCFVTISAEARQSSSPVYTCSSESCATTSTTDVSRYLRSTSRLSQYQQSGR